MGTSEWDTLRTFSCYRLFTLPELSLVMFLCYSTKPFKFSILISQFGLRGRWRKRNWGLRFQVHVKKNLNISHLELCRESERALYIFMCNIQQHMGHYLMGMSAAAMTPGNGQHQPSADFVEINQIFDWKPLSTPLSCSVHAPQQRSLKNVVSTSMHEGLIRLWFNCNRSKTWFWS